jgi:hypothetical protein
MKETAGLTHRYSQGRAFVTELEGSLRSRGETSSKGIDPGRWWLTRLKSICVRVSTGHSREVMDSPQSPSSSLTSIRSPPQSSTSSSSSPANDPGIDGLGEIGTPPSDTVRYVVGAARCDDRPRVCAPVVGRVVGGVEDERSIGSPSSAADSWGESSSTPVPQKRHIWTHST